MKNGIVSRGGAKTPWFEDTRETFSRSASGSRSSSFFEEDEGGGADAAPEPTKSANQD
jgi:hypothetical protein